jgi:signal transduction histidine kinase
MNKDNVREGPLKRKKLRSIFEVRNILIEYLTISEVVNKALIITREKLRSQTAAIFLFSKDGLLKRVGIRGLDKRGRPISDKWFSPETHLVGDSFTGKVVVPRHNSNFGEPRASNYIEKDELDEQSWEAYTQKLGHLRSVISVPLNGQHRTFGALEVINKLDEHNNISPTGFSQDDVYWLSIIGINVASAISNLRRNNELETLSKISGLIVEPFTNESDLEDVFNFMARIMVAQITSYKVCIIRTATDDNTLETAGMAAAENVSWDNWNDKPLSPYEMIPGEVFATGEKEIITDIEERKIEFKNIDWITQNGLKSYVCLPLPVKNKRVGTLSLFTGFNHQFYESDINYLEDVASLIASFIESSRIIRELRMARVELSRRSEEMANVARGAGFDAATQKYTHRYKHDLQKVQGALIEIQSGGIRKGSRLLGQQIEWISRQVKQIQETFESTSFKRMDVNKVIQKSVRAFFLEMKEKNITNSQDYTDLPDIEANSEQIAEIVYNLISNAIKAIESAKRRNGHISISTDTTDIEGIEHIEICVQDNGTGIRNEIKDLIFKRNFSTREGGTGMGLFLAREILQSYGGKISFESTWGKGSKFLVHLPLRRLEF